MRVTGPLLLVLRQLLDEPSRAMYGLELARATSLKSGTLYPLLDRLEAAGWVDSYWENDDAPDRAGPRRRFYRLTATGVHEAGYLLPQYGVTGLTWNA